MPRAHFLSLTGLLVSACALRSGDLAIVESSPPGDTEVAELERSVPMRPPRALSDDGTFYVLGEDPAHPRVRYGDGQLALNSSCAIRNDKKLSRRIPPVYVNGQPIGFC